jgi:hypothetical protein
LKIEGKVMPRPTGDPSKMTENEEREYFAYFAYAKTYAHNKATVHFLVEEKEEKEAVSKLLYESLEAFATFHRDKFKQALVSKLGFNEEKAASYASLAHFNDETYGVPDSD